MFSYKRTMSNIYFRERILAENKILQNRGIRKFRVEHDTTMAYELRAPGSLLEEKEQTLGNIQDLFSFFLRKRHETSLPSD